MCDLILFFLTNDDVKYRQTIHSVTKVKEPQGFALCLKFLAVTFVHLHYIWTELNKTMTERQFSPAFSAPAETVFLFAGQASPTVYFQFSEPGHLPKTLKKKKKTCSSWMESLQIVRK